MKREFRLWLQALAEGWPGLLFFAAMILAAFTMDGR